MDWSKWLALDWQQALGITISAIVAYTAIIAFSRFMGLRSFAKISSHDFAMTIAVGSILASTIVSKTPTLMQGLLAIVMLFILQAIVSTLRRKVKPVKKMIDNQPIVLMAHQKYYWDNIKEANLSKTDIQQVLRKNGLKSKSEVFAIIMETTGDMSVIKENDVEPDLDLFDDIRECEHLVDTKKFKN